MFFPQTIWSKGMKLLQWPEVPLVSSGTRSRFIPWLDPCFPFHLLYFEFSCYRSIISRKSRFFYLRLPFPSGRTVVDERKSFPDESIQGFLSLINEPVTSSWALSAFIYAIALLHPIEMEDGQISSLRDGATEKNQRSWFDSAQPNDTSNTNVDQRTNTHWTSSTVQQP
jgi:hypothetical protein